MLNLGRYSKYMLNLVTEFDLLSLSYSVLLLGVWSFTYHCTMKSNHICPKIEFLVINYVLS